MDENESQDPVVEIVRDNECEPPSRFVTLLQDDPEIMTEVRHYYALLQIEYVKRASEIEKFLGFVESAEELGARLARVERFVGIKG